MWYRLSWTWSFQTIKYYRRRLGHRFMCLQLGRHVEWLETAGEWGPINVVPRALNTAWLAVSCPSQSVGFPLTVCPASEAFSRAFDTILLLSSSFSVSANSVASLVRLPCPARLADPQGTLRHPSYGNPVSAAFHQIAGLLLGIWYRALLCLPKPWAELLRAIRLRSHPGPSGGRRSSSHMWHTVIRPPPRRFC